jgi:hypothetical protein
LESIDVTSSGREWMTEREIFLRTGIRAAHGITLPRGSLHQVNVMGHALNHREPTMKDAEEVTR